MLRRKRLAANSPLNFIGVNNIYSIYRSRALQRRVRWELSLVYFQELITRPCIYCEKPPANKRVLPTGLNFFYQGIDRVVNSEGYTETNTVPCCKECNAIKSNILTAQEMLAAMRAIKKVRK